MSNGENQLEKLTEAAKSLYEAGEPMIVTLDNLDVIENKFWGIEGGGKVDVTFIMNYGVPKKFSDQLNATLVPPPPGMNVTDEYGYFTNEEFKYVPNLYPFDPKGELIPPIPALNFSGFSLPFSIPKHATSEIRMTEILCSWMIEHSWNGLVGVDGKERFGGFKKIFEGL